MTRINPFCLASTLALVAGCRGQTGGKDPPIFGIRNMYDQPKYDVQEESSFFPDHRTMRPLVEGVIAREEHGDLVSVTGRRSDGSDWTPTLPAEVIQSFPTYEAIAARGHERYDIYCAPCHDMTGNGNGLVKQRAQASGATAFAPPSLHQDRLRHIPDGQLFATISNGKNTMPPYGAQLSVNDRWTIVWYVRQLQLASPKVEGMP